MDGQHKKMEEEHKKVGDRDKYEQRQHQPPYISEMKPVTHEAYGGGLYGRDDDKEESKNHEKELHQQHDLPASTTQSADGIDEAKKTKPRQKQPASSGDRDIDVTGQSYIQ